MLERTSFEDSRSFNVESKAANLHDFEILKSLGSGSYSQVFLVKRIQDDQLYAMKKVQILTISWKRQKNAINEVRILASLDH